MQFKFYHEGHEGKVFVIEGVGMLHGFRGFRVLRVLRGTTLEFLMLLV